MSQSSYVYLKASYDSVAKEYNQFDLSRLRKACSFVMKNIDEPFGDTLAEYHLSNVRLFSAELKLQKAIPEHLTQFQILSHFISMPAFEQGCRDGARGRIFGAWKQALDVADEDRLLIAFKACAKISVGCVHDCLVGVMEEYAGKADQFQFHKLTKYIRLIDGKMNIQEDTQRRKNAQKKLNQLYERCDALYKRAVGQQVKGIKCQTNDVG